MEIFKYTSRGWMGGLSALLCRLLLAGLGGLFIFELLTWGEVRKVSPEVRGAVRSVIWAYRFWEYLSLYWDEEFSKQCKLVRGMDLDQRMEFFVYVALHCNMENPAYFQIIFFEELGADEDAFHERMKEVAAQRGLLSPKQRKRLERFL
jgi:hypothetical protein